MFDAMAGPDANDPTSLDAPAPNAQREVEGLPYSLQLAGARLSEPLLCRIAAADEQATRWHDRHPALAV